MTKDNNNNNSDNTVEQLTNLFGDIRNIYEKHSDLFQTLGADKEKVDLSGKEPLTEAFVSEDTVKIVAEVSSDPPVRLGYVYDGGELNLDIGGRGVVVEVPDDIEEDTIEASMNNGIMRIEIERANDDFEDDSDKVTIEKDDDDEIDFDDDDTESQGENAAEDTDELSESDIEMLRDIADNIKEEQGDDDGDA